MSASGSVPARRASRVRAFAQRAGRLEKNSYASIARAIARRPAVPAGASAFAYHAPVRMVLIVFLVLSAAELVIVDVVVHSWPLVRIPLLIVGVWGVLFMIGMLCSFLMRPHTVGPDGLRVRNGMGLDIDLPWADVHSVEIKRRFYAEKPARLTQEGDDRVLILHVQSETNVEVELEGVTRIDLHGNGAGEDKVDATKVRFWVDDPKALLRAIAAHL